eukprot:m.285426 g.285426  ORF g.285426 m.285426 type:complete len:189 (+) comp54970_c0_seq5:105-671(+)
MNSLQPESIFHNPRERQCNLKRASRSLFAHQGQRTWSGISFAALSSRIPKSSISSMNDNGGDTLPQFEHVLGCLRLPSPHTRKNGELALVVSTLTARPRSPSRNWTAYFPAERCTRISPWRRSSPNSTDRRSLNRTLADVRVVAAVVRVVVVVVVIVVVVVENDVVVVDNVVVVGKETFEQPPVSGFK